MTKLKQDDVIIAEITDDGMEGEGIARYGEYTVFIPFCLKGEKVKAKITRVKNGVAYASLVEVLSPSEDRTVPPCNRFGKCGGCDLMHAEYNRQLIIKKNNVVRLLRKNAGLIIPVDDVEPCSSQFGYRNKIQLPFGFIAAEKRVTLGFYRENSHRVVAITKCFLHGEWAEKLIKIFLSYANDFKLSVYDETTGKGHLKHLVARCVGENISVVVVTDDRPLSHVDYLIEKLSEAFPSFSLYQSKKPEKTNVIMGKTIIPIKTTPFIIDVLGIKSELNPYSFLQLNDEIRDKIYTRIATEIPAGATVIDAYAGVGTLGAVLAKNNCRVYNVEIVEEATSDGNRLARLNGLSDKITNINGDAAIELPKLIHGISDTQSADLSKLFVILDPPRKGCDARVLEALKSIPCGFSVFYVSCNPATLTRDLKTLTNDDSFSVKYVKPYDMFPNTSHVETLVCLSKK